MLILNDNSGIVSSAKKLIINLRGKEKCAAWGGYRIVGLKIQIQT
jgi:hypothetical protein